MDLIRIIKLKQIANSNDYFTELENILIDIFENLIHLNGSNHWYHVSSSYVVTMFIYNSEDNIFRYNIYELETVYRINYIYNITQLDIKNMINDFIIHKLEIPVDKCLVMYL